MSRRPSILEGVYLGNGIEPTPHSLKFVNIVMRYDCIGKLRGHVCMTMRVGGIQNKLNKTIPTCGFSFILLRFPQEPGRYIIVSDMVFLHIFLLVQEVQKAIKKY